MLYLENKQVEVKVISDPKFLLCEKHDDPVFDYDTDFENLKIKADYIDYAVAAASGLLCGLLDIFWVGEFSLEEGRNISSDGLEKIIIKIAKLKGCDKNDIASCVKYLENMYPLASDGNIFDFGGGTQHHLNDFAHHPTIIGLIFSLLTQFTGKSFGTDSTGIFKIVDVVESSQEHIGQSIPSKIINGTVNWFFHLVSDMAGSNKTAGISGGTGIPGPILSLAKELSSLPIFRDAETGENNFSKFITNLYNGKLFAKRDENGCIIPDSVLQIDLRTELGALLEVGKQAVPVIANECIVRTFYFLRRVTSEVKKCKISSMSDLKKISWEAIKPYKNATLGAMLTVSSGVFTTVDIAEAIISKKYFISINYVGVARFFVAIGENVAFGLKRRKNIKKIKESFDRCHEYIFNGQKNQTNEGMWSGFHAERMGLTLKQTEILYNIEYYKVLDDIKQENSIIGKESIKDLKCSWLNDWKEYMTMGFAEFTGVKNAELHWYLYDELIEEIENLHPDNTWYKLVLFEAMLFEPYFALTTEKDKNGKVHLSKKYKVLENSVTGFKKTTADEFLEKYFSKGYCNDGFIKRLRVCYNKVTNELKEILKTTLISVGVTAGIVLVTVLTAGAFAPQIAVALVGANFANLSGAALTSACLAYLGGGAIAAGGAGMAGGTIAIVGGGAILGFSAGASAGGTAAMFKISGKNAVVTQLAKLMVSIREIFLNEEKNIEYAEEINKQYLANYVSLRKELAGLKEEIKNAVQDDKRIIKIEIKNLEESLNVMEIARKSINKYILDYKIANNV